MYWIVWTRFGGSEVVLVDVVKLLVLFASDPQVFPFPSFFFSVDLQCLRSKERCLISAPPGARSPSRFHLLQPTSFIAAHFIYCSPLHFLQPTSFFAAHFIFAARFICSMLSSCCGMVLGRLGGRFRCRFPRTRFRVGTQKFDLPPFFFSVDLQCLCSR